MALLTLLGLLLPVVGCQAAIRGEWELVRAIPNREFFAIDDARFAKDDRYEARITLEGRTVRETGRYEFNGYRLFLHPDAGGQHVFDANLNMKRLEVRRGDQKAILEKK